MKVKELINVLKGHPPENDISLSLIIEIRNTDGKFSGLHCIRYEFDKEKISEFDVDDRVSLLSIKEVGSGFYG
jgi:hypothetical protein